MALMGCACSDDFLFVDSENGEGERDIEMSVEFMPMHATALSSNTRAPGDAIEKISDLTVVAYDRFGKFYRIWRPTDSDGKMTTPSLSSVDVSVLDQGGNTVKNPTIRATFTLKDVPFGKYSFYAIANCGNITPEMVETPEMLKNIQLKWDTSAEWYNAKSYSTSKGNAQLMGFFEVCADLDSEVADRTFGFDAPQVNVNKDSGIFHSWLHRAASKVTVAYDPSGLHQGVTIYVKSVTIRDIPLTCKLGADNTPDNSSQLQDKGETIYYSTSYNETTYQQEIVYQSTPEPDYQKWPTLSRGSGIKGSHTPTTPALYFYENMQGDYSTAANKEHYDKRQDKGAVGTNIYKDGQPDFKDDVKYGTYIEVVAYYASVNPANTTNGNIVYRFMLGQDEKYNYNARRNHHYMLTLGFNGWANQPDWHINYVEDDPGLYAPETFLVSYLYHQQAMMPIKINGNCISLKAQIVENNWAPYQQQSNPDLPQVPAATVGEFKWNRDAYITGPPDAGPLNGVDHPELGFLALHIPQNSGDIPARVLEDINYQSYADGLDKLRKYYDNNNQGERSYNMTPGAYDIGYNGYDVKNANDINGNGYTPCPTSADACRMVNIPVWTRAKTMIRDSGWSGANPYEEFQRYAHVVLTAQFRLSNGQIVTRTRDVRVLQVRRLVNPKAVWRSADNSESFNVNLMQSPTPGAHSFAPLESVGEWKAYIETTNGHDGFIGLNGGNRQNKDTIYGDTGAEVKFNINFSGATSTKDPRCAIVTVLYHGNNCVHKIFVRQGYEYPMQLTPGGAKWSSFSLYSCQGGTVGQTSGTVEAQRTQSPIALGTLFKLRNYQEGLLVENNALIGPMVPPMGAEFLLTNGKPSKSWNDISYGYTEDESLGWANFQITQDGRTINYKVPTYQDFKDLEAFEYGFGVVYANGAKGTASNEDTAYGYLDSWNKGPEDGRGMRCAIIYNLHTAQHIIFPIGFRGMSRRTQFNLQVATSEVNNWRGILRYSDVSLPLEGDNNMYRAINYNLPYCPGAIYWIDKYVEKGHREGDNWYPTMGWDINYFTYHFTAYTRNNRYDACPAKLIQLDD